MCFSLIHGLFLKGHIDSLSAFFPGREQQAENRTVSENPQGHGTVTDMARWGGTLPHVALKDRIVFMTRKMALLPTGH
jgi:hypothetical protein